MRYVYFFKPVGCDGPIKIGSSTNPEARRALLQVSSPLDLEIAAQLEDGEYMERRFHAMFHGSHLRNEWFKQSPELDAVIEAIRKGTFDPACLPAAVYLPRPSRKAA